MRGLQLAQGNGRGAGFVLESTTATDSRHFNRAPTANSGSEII